MLRTGGTMQASSASKQHTMVSSKFKKTSAFINSSLRVLILDTSASVIPVMLQGMSQESLLLTLG